MAGRTDLEQLVFQMSTDIRKLEKANQRAIASTNKSAGDIEKRLDKLSKADFGQFFDKTFSRSRIDLFRTAGARIPLFGSQLELLGGYGLAAAAGVGAVALALGQAKAAMDFADEVSDTANRLHVTTDALQEYRYAIVQAGGEEKGADEALEAFSVTLGKAQEGLAKSQKGFLALGFTKEQINSWSTVEEALDAVIRKVGEIRSNPQKDAVIQQLGLDGIKPLVESGIDEVKRLQAEAQRIGVVMDAGLIAKAGEAHDKFETLQKIVKIQLMSAFVDLAPVLVDLMKTLADMARFAANIADSFRDIEHRRDEAIQAEIDDLKAERDRVARSKGKRIVVGMSQDEMLAQGLAGAAGGGQVPIQTTDNKAGELARLDGKIASLQAILDQRAKDRAVPPPIGDKPLVPQGPSTPDKSAQVAQRSRQVIAEALRGQADAEIALTDSVDKNLQYELDRIEAQRKEANDRLDYEASRDEITKAAAEEAKAANDAAAKAKADLAQRKADEATLDADLEQNRIIAQLVDQEWQIRADMADTLMQRVKLEREMLLAAQRRRLDELKIETDRAVAHGALSRDDADARIRAELALQKAERDKMDHDTVQTIKSGLLDMWDAVQNRGQSVFDYLADRFKAKLLDALAEDGATIIAQLLHLMTSQGGGSGTVQIGNAIAQFAGAFAGGGTIPAGQWGIVNDGGMEAIRAKPGGGIEVANNSSLRAIARMPSPRGGGGVVQYITVQADGAILANEVFDRIDDMGRQAATVGMIGGAARGKAETMKALRRSRRKSL